MRKILTTKDGFDIFNENEMLWDTHDYNSKNPSILCNPFFLDKIEAKYAKNIKRSFFKEKGNAIKYQIEYIKGLSLNDLISCNLSKDDKLFVVEIEKLKEIILNYYST